MSPKRFDIPNKVVPVIEKPAGLSKAPGHMAEVKKAAHSFFEPVAKEDGSGGKREFADLFRKAESGKHKHDSEIRDLKVSEETEYSKRAQSIAEEELALIGELEVRRAEIERDMLTEERIIAERSTADENHISHFNPQTSKGKLVKIAASLPLPRKVINRISPLAEYQGKSRDITSRRRKLMGEMSRMEVLASEIRYREELLRQNKEKSNVNEEQHQTELSAFEARSSFYQLMPEADRTELIIKAEEKLSEFRNRETQDILQLLKKDGRFAEIIVQSKIEIILEKLGKKPERDLEMLKGQDLEVFYDQVKRDLLKDLIRKKLTDRKGYGEYYWDLSREEPVIKIEDNGKTLSPDENSPYFDQELLNQVDILIQQKKLDLDKTLTSYGIDIVNEGFDIEVLKSAAAVTADLNTVTVLRYFEEEFTKRLGGDLEAYSGLNALNNLLVKFTEGGELITKAARKARVSSVARILQKLNLDGFTDKGQSDRYLAEFIGCNLEENFDLNYVNKDDNFNLLSTLAVAINDSTIQIQVAEKIYGLFINGYDSQIANQFTNPSAVLTDYWNILDHATRQKIIDLHGDDPKLRTMLIYDKLTGIEKTFASPEGILRNEREMRDYFYLDTEGQLNMKKEYLEFLLEQNAYTFFQALLETSDNKGITIDNLTDDDIRYYSIFTTIFARKDVLTKKLRYFLKNNRDKLIFQEGSFGFSKEILAQMDADVLNQLSDLVRPAVTKSNRKNGNGFYLADEMILDKNWSGLEKHLFNNLKKLSAEGLTINSESLADWASGSELTDGILEIDFAFLDKLTKNLPENKGETVKKHFFRGIFTKDSPWKLKPGELERIINGKSDSGDYFLFLHSFLDLNHPLYREEFVKGNIDKLLVVELSTDSPFGFSLNLKDGFFTLTDTDPIQPVLSEKIWNNVLWGLESGWIKSSSERLNRFLKFRNDLREFGFKTNREHIEAGQDYSELSKITTIEDISKLSNILFIDQFYGKDGKININLLGGLDNEKRISALKKLTINKDKIISSQLVDNLFKVLELSKIEGLEKTGRTLIADLFKIQEGSKVKGSNIFLSEKGEIVVDIKQILNSAASEEFDEAIIIWQKKKELENAGMSPNFIFKDSQLQFETIFQAYQEMQANFPQDEYFHLAPSQLLKSIQRGFLSLERDSRGVIILAVDQRNYWALHLSNPSFSRLILDDRLPLNMGKNIQIPDFFSKGDYLREENYYLMSHMFDTFNYSYALAEDLDKILVLEADGRAKLRQSVIDRMLQVDSFGVSSYSNKEILRETRFDKVTGITLEFENEAFRKRYKASEALKEIALVSEDGILIQTTINLSKNKYNRFTDKMIEIADGKVILKINEEIITSIFADIELEPAERLGIMQAVINLIDKPVHSDKLTTSIDLGQNKEAIQKMVKIFKADQQQYSQLTYLNTFIFQDKDFYSVLEKIDRYFEFRNVEGGIRPLVKEELLFEQMLINTSSIIRQSFLNDLNNKGFIDFSERQNFSRESQQFWVLYARNSETAKMLDKYLTESDGRLTIDFENFKKDFDPYVVDKNGLKTWKYRVSSLCFEQFKYSLQAQDRDDLRIAFQNNLVDLSKLDLPNQDEYYWQLWGSHAGDREFKDGLSVLKSYDLFSDLKYERGPDGKLESSAPIEKIISILKVGRSTKDEASEPLKKLIDNPRINNIIDLAAELTKKTDYYPYGLESDFLALDYLVNNPGQKDMVFKFSDFGYNYSPSQVAILAKNTTERLEQYMNLIKNLRQHNDFRSGNFEADMNVLGQLLENETMINTVLKLGPYGYKFNINDLTLLEAMTPQLDKIIADAEEVRAACPTFEYNPRSVTRFSVFATVVKADINKGSFSVDQLKKIIREKISTELVSGDYEILKSIGLRRDIEVEFVPVMIAWHKGFEPEQIERLNDSLQGNFYSTATGKEALLDFMISADQLLTPEKIESLIKFLPKAGSLIADKSFHNYLIRHLDNLAAIEPEKIGDYKIILQHILQSPSQEILRLKEELLNQVLETQNPEETYNQVEEVFIKNNLPLVGKIYRIVEILYPNGVMKSKIRLKSSHVLQRSGYRRRLYTLYQDLLKVHIDSGNKSLTTYLDILQSGQKTLSKLETDEPITLDYRERLQLTYFFDKLDALYQNSMLGKAARIERKAVSREDLLARYLVLKENLGVAEGQTLIGRIEEMYLKPIGINAIDEALERMKLVKSRADARGRVIYETADEGKVKIEANDLLKGVQDEYFELIMQNGSLAKECLGSSSSSDATPFDTDVSMVLAGDAEVGWEKTLDESIATGYGNLIFCFKDRGQFQKTTSETEVWNDISKYELFHTGVLGDRHYGIRTGIPITEVDYMIVLDSIKNDRPRLDKIYYSIAQNGYYIPVTDASGEIIFTPQMFDDYRRAFDGIERYEGNSLELKRIENDSPVFGQINSLVQEIKKDHEKVASLSSQVREKIEEALNEMDVHLKDQYDQSILGAELFDTGSTGRGTNTPGDYDFDLALTLDTISFTKVNELARLIKERLNPLTDNSHMESNYYQIRAIGATEIGENPIDVDIGITSQSDLRVFNSHDAIQTKLDFIKNRYGEDAYYEVIANIILAKKILKEGHAYKRLEHGGLGGIGLESWLLLNGGSMLEAFKSFFKAAHDEKGNILPFEDFQRIYPIRDAGMNLKKLKYDNYIYTNLNSNGFQAMLNTIEAFFKANNMSV